MSFTAWFLEQFYRNEFMQAAVVAAPVTALVWSVRQLPLRLWQLLKRSTTLEVSFNSDIADYSAIQKFVMGQIVSTRLSRSFLYQTEASWDEGPGGERIVDHQGLTVGYGPHFGWYGGRLVLITRSSIESAGVEKFKERLELTFFTRRRSVIEGLVAALREHSLRGRDPRHVPLFINSEGWWRRAARLPLRPIETVFTAGGKGGKLIEHIRNFEGRRAWHRERGLPWHTGILLTGSPGTGKTSLIHAAASETSRSLRYLNLGSVEHDRQLTDLVSSGSDWDRCILVIEDADAAGAEVSRAGPADGERKPLTLSALLNVLDGLITPDGLVVIASSNHPERLDPALIRSGRFDLQIELGPLSWAEFASMADLFGYSVASDDRLRRSYLPMPGAELRARLLEGGPGAVADLMDMRSQEALSDAGEASERRLVTNETGGAMAAE